MEVIINGIKYIPEIHQKNISFHSLIMNGRRQRGITQQDAANDIGVSKSYLCQLEKGVRTPSFVMAKQILEYYQIPNLGFVI